MKKILSIIGTISLITSGSSNLIACNNNQLTSEKLAELKEENSKTINGNKLEWIAPQEKRFNTVDNKWYVVIWRGDENDNWRIIKFKNDKYYKEHRKMLDKQNNMELYIGVEIYWGYETVILFIVNNNNDRDVKWNKDNGKYFKAVYRWNGVSEPSIPKINRDGEITD